jgi:hypothetical protein
MAATWLFTVPSARLSSAAISFEDSPGLDALQNLRLSTRQPDRRRRTLYRRCVWKVGGALQDSRNRGRELGDGHSFHDVAEKSPRVQFVDVVPAVECTDDTATGRKPSVPDVACLA